MFHVRCEPVRLWKYYLDSKPKALISSVAAGQLICPFVWNMEKKILFHYLAHTVCSIYRCRLRYKQKIGYQGENNHLRHTLKKLGFRWRKSQTNKSLLMERTDIVAARIQFLRNIKKYRENGRLIIYTDETFVHSTHTVSKLWQSSKVSLQAPFCRGERLIVLHAGSKGDSSKELSLFGRLNQVLETTTMR